jgi:hypothetical protein
MITAQHFLNCLGAFQCWVATISQESVGATSDASHLKQQRAIMFFIMPTQPTVSHDLLNAALHGLESQKITIEAHIAQVRSLLGTGPKRRGRPPKSAQATDVAEPKKRHFSAATRRKMAAGQRRRYAALRGETATTTTTKQVAATPKKRTMSAAGRKRIADAARKRWAAIRKAKSAA